MPELVWLLVVLVVGIALGFVVTRFVLNSRAKDAADNADRVIKDAAK